MLVIRREQFDILARQSRISFEDRLVSHFMDLYPRECRQAGGRPQICDLVRRGVERAGRNDFTTEAQIGLFIALLFMLGDTFDHDPQLPWASKLLHGGSIRNPEIRIRAVFDEAIAYLGATAGRHCEHVVRAMLRVQKYDPAKAPAWDAEWESNALKLLRELYPQKFDHQGVDANRLLLEQSLVKVDVHTLSSKESAMLVATLMFMLGSGFDRDPLHPWAERILSEPASAGDRAERLYQAAMSHIAESLLPDPS